MGGKTPILLLCVLFVPAIGASAPGQQNPNGQVSVFSLPDPYLVLIRDPLLHRELRLTEEQVRGVTAFNDQQDSRLWTIRNQPADKAAAAFQQLTDTARGRMDSLLTKPQTQRLAQIQLQVFGVRALLRDEVATAVRLTDGQRTEIRELLANHESGNQQGGNQQPKPPGSDGKPAESGSNSRPSAPDPRQRIWEMLDRNQQTRLQELFGRGIDTSRLGYVKFKAPELSGSEGWLNTPPLSLEQLRGKVVALHFWTFG
jgi:hypothetical protein